MEKWPGFQKAFPQNSQEEVKPLTLIGATWPKNGSGLKKKKNKELRNPNKKSNISPDPLMEEIRNWGKKIQ